MIETSYLRSELKELTENFFDELVDLVVDEIKIHLEEILWDCEDENKSCRDFTKEELPEDWLDRDWINETKKYLIRSFIPDMFYMENIILKIVSIKTAELDRFMKEWKDSKAKESQKQELTP